MKLTVVGSGSGITSLKRYHSALYLTDENSSILIDAGDGVSRALLSSKINYAEIDYILISHFHPDHYAGLPSLLVQMKLMNRRSQLNLIAESGKIDFIKALLKNSFIYEEALPFELVYLTLKTGASLYAGSFEILAEENSHLNKYKDYPVSGKSFGFLLRSGGKSIFYTGDTGSKKDLLLFPGERLDLLITDSSHIPASELEEKIIKRNPGSVLFTHIGEENEAEIISLVEKLNGNIDAAAAYDGYSATF